MDTRRYLKELPVRLTPAERALKNDEVLELLDLIDDLAEEKKETASAMATQIKKAKKDGMELRKQLSANAEKRQVEVEERLDFRDHTVVTVRLDTGEVISERTMRTEEAQTTMEVIDGGGETVAEVWGMDGERATADPNDVL